MNSITLAILVYLALAIVTTIVVVLICAQSARISRRGGMSDDEKWQSSTQSRKDKPAFQRQQKRLPATH